MAVIQTLGEAFSAGLGVRMRCGRSDHRGIVRVARCGFETELSMETLTATRGRAFPLARLASRLKCPNCGDGNIQVLFDVPGSALPIHVPQSPYRKVG